MNSIRLYDANMKKIAYLQNAFDITYNFKLNELWYAGFSLPAHDPKCDMCKPFCFVELYENGERLELFRIICEDLSRSDTAIKSYQCEHVLATLLDDVMFKYHQIGNIGVHTAQVLRYILDKQTVNRWQLGEVDFMRQFEYKFENENLLRAVFSVANPLDEPYRFTFDTQAVPWTLNLKRLPTQINGDIRYEKNIHEIKKQSDGTNLITRLFCLGYGEGDNQLTIESANDGVPYLEKNVARWGVKSSILVDRRFEHADTLKAYGQSILDAACDPYVTYSVKAADLHRLFPTLHDKFVPGNTIRLTDKVDGIVFDAPVVQVSKRDMLGNPGDIEIVLANKSRDVAGSISDLADRTRINEVYAQGATNQMILNFADNADASNPVTLRLYIPDTMARINKCILNYQLERFRAYSKANESAAQSTTGQSSITSSGASSTSTTQSGGGTTSGPSSTSTTQYDGGQTSNGSSLSTTRNGGGKVETSGLAIEVQYGEHWTSNNRDTNAPSHVHPIQNWTVTHKHATILPDHQHDMAHTHTVPSHIHGMNHTHTIASHSHGMAHTHNIAHTHTIPGHSHGIVYGIYQGSTANSVTIRVDGKNVPSPTSGMDVIPCLAVDDSGRITRNTWHTIEIVPDTMTRIVAAVFMQIFTNSRGGGDY